MNKYKKVTRFIDDFTKQYWYAVPVGSQQAMVAVELLFDGSDLTPRRCEIRFVSGDGATFNVHPDRLFEQVRPGDEFIIIAPEEVPEKRAANGSEWVTCPTCKGDSISYWQGMPRACSTCMGHSAITREQYEESYAPR